MKSVEEFGYWLARERYDRGLTLSGLSDRVGKHIDSNIMSYEVGYVAPTLRTALKLAKALNHDIEVVSKEELELLELFRKADDTMRGNIVEILKVSNK